MSESANKVDEQSKEASKTQKNDDLEKNIGAYT